MHHRLFIAIPAAWLFAVAQAEEFSVRWVFSPPATVTRWLVTDPIPSEPATFPAVPVAGAKKCSAAQLSWSGATGGNGNASVRFANEPCSGNDTGVFLRVDDVPDLTGDDKGGGFETLHLKAKVRLATRGRTQCLIRKTEKASPLGYILNITEEDEVVFALGGESAHVSIKTTHRRLQKKVWYDIEAIWDGISVQILIDGELSSDIVDFSDRLTDTSGPLTFGALDRGNSTGQFLDGWIAEIEISGDRAESNVEDTGVKADSETTAWGIPVKKMWFCPPHSWNRPALGIPMAKGVVHAPIFEPEFEEGAYNHHPEIAFHDGFFYAMWSNNLIGEDRPGQRILYSATADITRWPAAKLLFPQPGPFSNHEENGDKENNPIHGFYTTAMKFIPLNGTLYAVAALDGLLDGSRKRITPIVRPIGPEGPIGEILAIQENYPDFPADQLDFELVRPDTPERRKLTENLLELYLTPKYLPSWNFGIEERFPRPKMIEGKPMCEWSIHQTIDGRFMMLARDLRHSHRMYAGISDTGDPNSFSPLEPTDIPDTPSKAVTVTLKSGHVLLIGNQLAREFDRIEEPTHYSRDPLTISISSDGYRFEKQLVLRWEGGRRWRTEPHRVTGRGGGCQYPSAMVRNDILYVIYSIGKEDIAISWLPLSRLPL